MGIIHIMFFLTILLFFPFVFSLSAVNELKEDYYLGHWYQVYGAPLDYIIQGNGKCITADYAALPDNKISVLNKEITQKGEPQSIEGYAYLKNVSEPGEFTVHFDTGAGDAPYWVIMLGPEINNQYAYSIVSEPNAFFMWVLVRDVEDFYNTYDEEVKEFLKENNFKYNVVSQEDCTTNYL